MEVPIFVTFFVLLGSVTRGLWGWLTSGESFNRRKFSATMIFTVMAALPIALGIFNSSMIVDTGGMVALCLTALIAGWGVDTGLKEMTKFASKK